MLLCLADPEARAAREAEQALRRKQSKNAARNKRRQEARAAREQLVSDPEAKAAREAERALKRKQSKNAARDKRRQEARAARGRCALIKQTMSKLHSLPSSNLHHCHSQGLHDAGTCSVSLVPCFSRLQVRLPRAASLKGLVAHRVACRRRLLCPASPRQRTKATIDFGSILLAICAWRATLYTIAEVNCRTTCMPPHQSVVDM